MATVQFLLKTGNNPSTIYVRLRDGRKIDFTTSTFKTIDPKHWTDPPKKKASSKTLKTQKKKNWIKERSVFQGKLNLSNDLLELKSLILKERNDLVGNGQSISKEWLQLVVSKWQGKNTGEDSDALINRMVRYKEELPNKVRVNGKIGVAQGTIRNYNTTIERLKKFEKYKKKSYGLTEIDLTFHSLYLKFAKERLGLSKNSIGKDIRQIKTVGRDSRDKGFNVNEQLFSSNFKAPSEETLFVTLNQSELELINAFEGSDYLTNAKDWLIIGCYTGCRVGDLMQLTMGNVVNHKTGAKVIQYTQSKTGKMVNVPIHPMVESILKRRGGFPRSISDQRFNDYIKEVCRSVGLVNKVEGSRQNRQTRLKEVGTYEKWELVQSHICRRSFATNHYNKLPNKLIMAVTGHATETMLLNYIGEVESDHVKDFIELWSENDKPISLPLQNRKKKF